jgi:hypothetical protein
MHTSWDGKVEEGDLCIVFILYALALLIYEQFFFSNINSTFYHSRHYWISFTICLCSTFDKLGITDITFQHDYVLGLDPDYRLMC